MVDIESLMIKNLIVNEATCEELDWILDLPPLLKPTCHVILSKDYFGYTLESVGSDIYVFESFVLLRTVQRYIRDFVKGIGKISIVKFDGKFFLLDGTHRFVSGCCNEQTIFDALYLDLSSV